MAIGARYICRQAGCGTLLDCPGYCEPHRKARQQADAVDRGTAHERGYTSAWVKARAAYLAKHPLCVHCAKLGRAIPATVVDHIIPPRMKAATDSGIAVLITKASALFWDSARNWQPLCKHHHDVKTATEDGGFGRV